MLWFWKGSRQMTLGVLVTPWDVGGKGKGKGKGEKGELTSLLILSSPAGS
jgi:hypothetical protein